MSNAHVELTGNHFRVQLIFDSEETARLFVRAMPDDRAVGRAFSDWLGHNLLAYGLMPDVQKRLRALLSGFKSFRVSNLPPDPRKSAYEPDWRPLSEIRGLSLAEIVAGYSDSMSGPGELVA